MCTHSLILTSLSLFRVIFYGVGQHAHSQPKTSLSGIFSLILYTFSQMWWPRPFRVIQSYRRSLLNQPISSEPQRFGASVLSFHLEELSYKYCSTFELNGYTAYNILWMYVIIQSREFCITWLLPLANRGGSK